MMSSIAYDNRPIRTYDFIQIVRNLKKLKVFRLSEYCKSPFTCRPEMCAGCYDRSDHNRLYCSKFLHEHAFMCVIIELCHVCRSHLNDLLSDTWILFACICKQKGIPPEVMEIIEAYHYASEQYSRKRSFLTIKLSLAAQLYFNK